MANETTNTNYTPRTDYSAATIIGRVIRDLEMKTAPSGVQYVELVLASTRVFKDVANTLYFKAFLRGDDATRMINAKVKKGSSLLVNATIDDVSVFEKEKDDAKVVYKTCIVSVKDWTYVPSTGGSKHETAPKFASPAPAPAAPAAAAPSAPAPAVAPAPAAAPVFQDIGDDDLPF